VRAETVVDGVEAVGLTGGWVVGVTFVPGKLVPGTPP
jgi:hypothetical protein